MPMQSRIGINQENLSMKTLFKTHPLNDGTTGFRFDLLGKKGLFRKRILQRRLGISTGATMRAIHFGKRSVYFELKKPVRKFYDFAKAS